MQNSSTPSTSGLFLGRCCEFKSYEGKGGEQITSHLGDLTLLIIEKEKQMRKYTGFVVVAAFLLSILVGVFLNEIGQVDAITYGVAIIFGLLLLYIVGLNLFYKSIDWNKPNVFVRPFLPPMGSEKPHGFTDQNEEELTPFHFKEATEEERRGNNT